MHRVVVTGIGLVTPLGVGVNKSWSRLFRGDSGIRSTTELGLTFENISSKVAAWVPDTEIDSHFQQDDKEFRILPKFIKYAIVAADEAVKDSGINVTEGNEFGGVSVGVGMSPLDFIGDSHDTMNKLGARRVTPHLIPRILNNIPAGHLAIRYKLHGPFGTPSTACASGANAIGDAFRMIKHGYAKFMVAGATEAAVNPLSMAGFSQARALSCNFNNEPTRSSRPFDKDRDGFVIGEGAGIMVLEELNQALERRANIYGEIVGYGCSSDAHHITASHPDGHGAESAMRKALREASLDANEIQLVNAHATSTPIGDSAEVRALKRIFINRPDLLVSANKGALGHLLGAAGAVESIFSLLSLRNGRVPMNLNINNLSPEFKGFDYISGDRDEPHLKSVLCNSFGFGGVNASLVFSKYL